MKCRCGRGLSGFSEKIGECVNCTAEKESKREFRCLIGS